MVTLYECLSLEQWGLTPFSWGIFCLAVFVVGFSKTGLPGITIITVPMMAAIIPPKESVGVLLPVFMLADVFSIIYYRRFAVRNYCFPYLLFVGLGVLAASFVVGSVDNKMFGAVIGWTVISLVMLSIWTDRVRKRLNLTELPPPEKPKLVHSAFFGLSAGLFSALANAAGPIVSLYMITSRLEKFQLLGTSAVCAFVMNWIKVPLFLSLKSINAETLKLGVAAIPMVALGALTGAFVARKLPQKIFKDLVLCLAVLASLKLIVG